LACGVLVTKNSESGEKSVLSQFEFDAGSTGTKRDQVGMKISSTGCNEAYAWKIEHKKAYAADQLVVL
jgi:hypothetical protein